jgi:CheY-like chemotaxis protein
MQLKPQILVINDDRSLLATRQMLLESCGAEVFTAAGTEEALREALKDPVDLAIIDATNVGLEHGETLCRIIKNIHPSKCVALLIEPEMGLPNHTLADRIIPRTGPRRMLVEINELLGGRLDLNLWEGRIRGDSHDRSS